MVRGTAGRTRTSTPNCRLFPAGRFILRYRAAGREFRWKTHEIPRRTPICPIEHVPPPFLPLLSFLLSARGRDSSPAPRARVAGSSLVILSLSTISVEAWFSSSGGKGSVAVRQRGRIRRSAIAGIKDALWLLPKRSGEWRDKTSAWVLRSLSDRSVRSYSPHRGL